MPANFSISATTGSSSPLPNPANQQGKALPTARPCFSAMESALASAAAITDQRQKIEQYKSILTSILASPTTDIPQAKRFIDHMVSDDVPLVPKNREEEHRKRKGLQSLKRLEVKQRRLEKWELRTGAKHDANRRAVDGLSRIRSISQMSVIRGPLVYHRGPLEAAMACHGRISTSTAQLVMPELRLGIIPGFGEHTFIVLDKELIDGGFVHGDPHVEVLLFA